MAQHSVLEKKRVGGPMMGRGPSSKRSRVDAEKLLMEVNEHLAINSQFFLSVISV